MVYIYRDIAGEGEESPLSLQGLYIPPEPGGSLGVGLRLQSPPLVLLESLGVSVSVVKDSPKGNGGEESLFLLLVSVLSLQVEESPDFLRILLECPVCSDSPVHLLQGESLRGYRCGVNRGCKERK